MAQRSAGQHTSIRDLVVGGVGEVPEKLVEHVGALGHIGRRLTRRWPAGEDEWVVCPRERGCQLGGHRSWRRRY